MKTCLDLKDTIFPIKLIQQGRNRFTVTYGVQVKKDLDYAAAALELGACIMHALACDRKLDNRMPGEKI